jgi:branched-chain amino acid transport system substrate-binding protein
MPGCWWKASSAPAGTLNRETFINAIESIQKLDLGIANLLSFSPRDHQGLERVYFTHLQDGKFVWRNH